MGGGAQNMGLPMDGPIDEGSCVRKDKRNLARSWLLQNEGGKLVTNTSQLMSLDIANTSSVLGIFSQSHMPYHAVRTSETPTLANMTMQAIRILKKNKKGFFLMVTYINNSTLSAPRLEPSVYFNCFCFSIPNYDRWIIERNRRARVNCQRYETIEIYCSELRTKFRSVWRRSAVGELSFPDVRQGCFSSILLH